MAYWPRSENHAHQKRGLFAAAARSFSNSLLLFTGILLLEMHPFSHQSESVILKKPIEILPCPSFEVEILDNRLFE